MAAILRNRLEDFMSFCIFSIATAGSAKIPDFYHDKTLDMLKILDILVYAEAPQNMFNWSLCGES